MPPTPWISIVAGVTVAALCCGCGQPAPPPPASQANANPAAPAPAAPAPPAPATATAETPAAPELLAPAAASTPSPVRVDDQGRKWLGDIPYDVWFDDPLSLVADEELNATADPHPPSTETAVTQPQPPLPAETSPPTDAPASENSPSEPDWNSLIAADALADEVSSIHNRLAAASRSVAQYNRTHKERAVDAATLAVLGEIAGRHAGDIRWKRHARLVRDVGMRLTQSTQTPGKESFDATRAEFQELGSILNGSPASDSQPPESIDFAAIAERPLLMKRIEMAFEWLRKNANSETSLAQQSGQAAHEAGLLAVLATVIATPEYSLADEADYRAHAAALTAAAQDAARAAAGPKFAEFSAALASAQNSCTACHRVYRFGE